MLSRKTQTNFANAKGYFEEHLCVGDYATFRAFGRGRMQVCSALKEPSREGFLALCENRHPTSAECLTQRQKTTG